jgi:ATP-binding cassette, subfamily A (ABC1), member 3
MIIKRYIHSVRNKSLIISQILLPVIILLTNLLYIKYAIAEPDDSPALKIDLLSYDQNYIPFTINNLYPTNIDFNQSINSIEKYYEKQLSEYSNVKAFELKDTSIVENCGEKRENIHSYLSCLSRVNYRMFTKEHFIATEFKIHTSESRRNKLFQIITHFNNQAYHVAPLAVNLVTNALFKHFTNSIESKIHVINRPWPKNATEILNDATNKNMNSFRVATALNFCLSFLVASFSIFLIKETISGAKHLQFLNSCNYYVFWLSAFVWDFINYLIPIIFVIALLFVSRCFILFVLYLKFSKKLFFKFSCLM